MTQPDMWISHHTEPAQHNGLPAWRLRAVAHVGEKHVCEASVMCAGGRGSYEQSELFWYLDDGLKRRVEGMEKRPEREP